MTMLCPGGALVESIRIPVEPAVRLPSIVQPRIETWCALKILMTGRFPAPVQNSVVPASGSTGIPKALPPYTHSMFQPEGGLIVALVLYCPAPSRSVPCLPVGRAAPETRPEAGSVQVPLSATVEAFCFDSLPQTDAA